MASSCRSPPSHLRRSPPVQAQPGRGPGGASNERRAASSEQRATSGERRAASGERRPTERDGDGSDDRPTDGSALFPFCKYVVPVPVLMRCCCLADPTQIHGRLHGQSQGGFGLAVFLRRRLDSLREAAAGGSTDTWGKGRGERGDKRRGERKKRDRSEGRRARQRGGERTDADRRVACRSLVGRPLVGTKTERPRAWALFFVGGRAGERERVVRTR